MKPYHKIKTVWKRDPENKYKTLIEGAWATPAIEFLKDCEWFWHEKVDGANIRITYFPVEDIIQVKGRTEKAEIPLFLLDAILDKIDNDLFQDAFDMDRVTDAPITLYGEGFGKKIQKVGHFYGEPDFCLFDITIGDFSFMEQNFVEEIAANMGLQQAPLRGFGTLQSAIDMIQHTELRSSWGDFPIEGFVLRPIIDLYDRNGNRIIGKIKKKDFPNER